MRGRRAAAALGALLALALAGAASAQTEGREPAFPPLFTGTLALEGEPAAGLRVEAWVGGRDCTEPGTGAVWAQGGVTRYAVAVRRDGGGGCTAAPGTEVRFRAGARWAAQTGVVAGFRHDLDLTLQTQPPAARDGDGDADGDGDEAAARDADGDEAADGDGNGTARRVIAGTGGVGVSHRDDCTDDARVDPARVGWLEGDAVTVLEQGSGRCAGWLRATGPDGFTGWVRARYTSPLAAGDGDGAARRVIAHTGGVGVSHRDDCRDDARVDPAQVGWLEGDALTVLEQGSGRCAGWLRATGPDGFTGWVRQRYTERLAG